MARFTTASLSTIALMVVLTTAYGAPKPTPTPDWRWLREASTEALKAASVLEGSPRYGVMLALHQIEEDVTEAMQLLDTAVAKAQPDSDEALLAAVLRCSFSELMGNTLSPAECNARGAALDNIQHPLPAAIGHVHFGIWLASNGQYSRAFQANRRAEELALAAGDARLAATTQNNLGVDYLIRGLPVQAMNKFELALDRLRSANRSDQQGFLNLLTSNIASAHLELGDFESANELLQTAINSDLYDRNNPTNLIDEVVLARATLALGEPQAGYERLSAVLEAIGPLGVSGIQAYAHSVLGDLQIALGDVEAGIASFVRARDYGERSGDPLRVNKVDVSFAEALVGLERFDEASAIIEGSITALTERGPSMILAQALDLRGDILRATGQRRLASTAKREARQVQTKVLGAEHEMDLAMLSKSLELANQASALATAQQAARDSAASAQRQITLRNQLILTTLLLALITYLVLSRRYERKVAKTVQGANAELELKVTERTSALEEEMAQRLEAEAQRQSLARTLAEAEKLQALGQLTSGVAHDFNNLMTVVTLSAELLRDSGEAAGEEASQHVENILSAAESASDITASLLAYARKQPLAPEATDLGTFITESLPLFERTLGEGQVLETAVEACTISVDRSKLTTAIINLLINAREALGAKGIVKLEVAELYQISEAGEPQHWATIAVRDRGIGMNATELQRATQPFYTTKAVGHGTGLGLSMVEGFAKQSGGFLQIDSVKDQGTVVTLHIPLSVESESGDEPPSAQGTRLPDQGLVMIVDDQRPIRDVLARLLAQMGLETLCASDASEALTLMETSARPDLLITDLMMPGELNGQQLATEVRKRYGDLPVLIMSGYSSSVELDVEFLHKPFSFDNLRDAIGRAIVHDRVA